MRKSKLSGEQVAAILAHEPAGTVTHASFVGVTA